MFGRTVMASKGYLYQTSANAREIFTAPNGCPRRPRAAGHRRTRADPRRPRGPARAVPADEGRSVVEVAVRRPDVVRGGGDLGDQQLAAGALVAVPLGEDRPRDQHPACIGHIVPAREPD